MYKATIQKCHEKADTHEFLIHYDGNKKSTVHWIGSNRINKILETDVDTPPQKNNSMASHRNKRSSCEKQRESLQNQERIESHRYGDAICQIHVLKKKKRKKKKVDGEESTVALQTTRSAPIQKYRAKLEDQWEEQFNQLMEFKSKEGHCNVPFNHGSLGKWVGNVS